MNDAIINLHHIHSLRHNFEMLILCNGSKEKGEYMDPVALTNHICREMKMYIDGLGLLMEERYAEYADWFVNNTSMKTQQTLASAIQQAAKEAMNSQES